MRLGNAHLKLKAMTREDIINRIHEARQSERRAQRMDLTTDSFDTLKIKLAGDMEEESIRRELSYMLMREEITEEEYDNLIGVL